MILTSEKKMILLRYNEKIVFSSRDAPTSIEEILQTTLTYFSQVYRRVMRSQTRYKN